jgi:hypothetical protein
MLDLDGQTAGAIRLRHSATGICWEYAPNATFTVRRGNSAQAAGARL